MSSANARLGCRAGATAGRGDVVVAGEPVAADGEVAQGGHDCGAPAGADLGQVFSEGDVADPVQRLDLPVPAYRLGDQISPCLTPAQAGDGIDRLRAPAGRADRSAASLDLDGKAGVRKPDPLTGDALQTILERDGFIRPLPDGGMGALNAAHTG